MILEMLRNSTLKHGGEIKTQVRYKIIWLEIAKEITNFYSPPCFQHVFVCSNFAQKQQFVLELNNIGSPKGIF